MESPKGTETVSAGREGETPTLQTALMDDTRLPDWKSYGGAGNRSQDGDSETGESLLSSSSDDDEDSPYPEVRAAVRNHDQDLPCNTVRVWVIGSLLVILSTLMNTIFSLRQPAIYVGSMVTQIIAYPMGHGWAMVMPRKHFNTFGYRWTLNPGPFNHKEHALITCMASVAVNVSYATDILTALMSFWGQDFGIPFQLLLTLSTQSIGYGLAGVLRKYLVYPASMLWPENLVAVTVMNVMYEKEKKTHDSTSLGGNMSRYKWFTLVMAGSFVYYFIPGFLAQCMSVFAVATWIAPQNPVVNQLFGGVTGLSIIPITFDWTQIAGYIGSPLMPPWEAIANTMLGVGIFYVFLAIIFQYSGAWYGSYLPMSDANVYDNTGKTYNISRVVNPDFTLNETAYKEYSPIFMSTTFAISHGLQFATMAALLVYIYLEYGDSIWKQFKNMQTEKPDIHMKLMRKYPEAPTWWYLSMFAVMMVLGFYTSLAYPTHLTWWAFILAIVIASAFSLSVGIVQAITGNQMNLTVVTEFVYGYLQPGRPLALMLFKSYGQVTIAQTMAFVSALKFGHYLKVPPRMMFICQVVATTIACVIQVIVLNMTISSVPDICTIQQRDRFSCPNGRLIFSSKPYFFKDGFRPTPTNPPSPAASVIWGLIGPSRVFSPGQMYSGLLIFFIVGAITPIIIYYGSKRWPNSPFKWLMAPLIFGGASFIPPATPLNYFAWGIVGFIFQYWIKKRHFKWWTRLNFVTSGGLDLGLALSTLFIFFAFTLPGVEPPNWWGNNVVTTTMDFQGTAIRRHMPDGQIFGPSTW
ncbi:Sexual differentiation process protein isp4 [Cladobotryum mycophilum]|uniref:Sexual differentiation process protein isp4 n=1 Tax=Cladobotryum mycophilum TaxID=491253 RepID=A0ABR0SEC6_9HYPO